MNTINYPAYIVWHKKIAHLDPLENFSPRHKKRLTTSINKISNLKISHELNEVDGVFLDWFQDYYIKSINIKKNPNLGNISETIKKYLGKCKCYGLKLYENNQVIGGAIYIHKKNRITTAFKVFLPQWLSSNLPVSPTMYAEYILYSHAISHNYTTISHGQDRNPYGLNSDIGLCSFKLSLGYIPRISSNHKIERLDESHINSTCLVLNLPNLGTQIITEANLFIKESDLASAEMLIKYPDTLQVKINFLNYS